MSDRPVAVAGDGFEIVAHESAPIRYPEESHATVQICVPMDGARYKVTRETETGAVLEGDFEARDILLVPVGQRHAVDWLCRAGIVSLHISERFVQETLDIPRLRLPDSTAVQDRFVTFAAAEVYTSMAGGESISPMFAEATAIGIAQRVAAIASGSTTSRSVVGRRLTPPLLRRIERYVDERLEQQIGLAELALLAGLSRWHFLRIFQETAGTSPHGYITRRRLERAQTLLSSTDRSVMDIAADVGMTHSHFSRVFLRRLGITPTAFRRIFRQ